MTTLFQYRFLTKTEFVISSLSKSSWRLIFSIRKSKIYGSINKTFSVAYVMHGFCYNFFSMKDLLPKHSLGHNDSLVDDVTKTVSQKVLFLQNLLEKVSLISFFNKFITYFIPDNDPKTQILVSNKNVVNSHQ